MRLLKRFLLIPLFAIMCLFTRIDSSYAAGNCGISSLDTSMGAAVKYAYGYKNDSSGTNGAGSFQASEYGITTDNTWATEFIYGTVWGMAKCSETSGNNSSSTWPESSKSNWLKTPSDTTGQYCWCQATGFTASGNSYTSGPQCTTTASNSWVFSYDFADANDCASRCAVYCVYYVQGNAACRAGVFGAVPPDPTYTVTYSCGTGGGNAPTDSNGYNSGSTVTTLSNTCTAASGYGFSAWNCGGTNVNAGSTFTISANTTCTAQYSPNTININWWNGDTQLSVQNTAQSCVYDGTLTVPAQPTKPGYTFNGWKIMRVPRGFTELEYIESSGTQYIDTGFSAPNGFKAKVGLYFTTISPFFIMGAHGDVDPWGRNYFRIQNSASRLLFEVGAGDCWVSSYVVQPNTKYDIEFSTVKNNIFLNGDTLTHGWGDGDDTRSPYSIYLFAVHGYQGGKDKASMSGQMYYAKIYDENNVMVRQFIPARRNSDNVLGMWDTVTQTFFTNAGSGTFVAGPEIQ